MENENRGLIPLEVRKLPVILGFAAGAFFKIMSVFGGSSAVLSSLGEITLSASVFLFAVFCFNRINAIIEKEKAKKSEAPEDNIIAENAAESSDGLIEIKRAGALAREEARPRKTAGKTIASVSFIIFFAGLVCWHAIRSAAVLPLAYTELYNYSIVHAVLLLVFPFVTAIYLRMRKNSGLRCADKVSHGVLTIISYTALVYAAVIAARIVLNINILAAAQWFYYAVSIYLFAALSVNILISILKNDVTGSFNYAFVPKSIKIIKFKNKNKAEKTLSVFPTDAVPEIGVLDSEEARSNFSFKSLWTIRYLLRILPVLALSLGFILFFSTTVYIVQPYQQAAVYRFGKLTRESIAGPGLNFKFPWPVEKAEIYDVDRVNFIQIGYQAADSVNYLWNIAHDGGEHNLLLGNGNEAAAVNIKLIYKISDLYSYITRAANPQEILSAAAYNSILRRTVNTTLDTFLSVDRSSLSVSLTEELSAFCVSSGLGITVIQVIVESIHPPIDVADVYQKVVTASVDKNTIITNAKTAANQKIINTEQQVSTLIGRAKAEQYRRTGSAYREMAVYYAAMEAYNVNPQSFRLTKYLDTYERIIKGNKIYVFSPRTENEMSNFIIGEYSVLSPQ